MSERGEFRFTVKEYHDGTPWIAFEPAGSRLTSVKGLLGFDLEDGATFNDAKDIARYMNDHIGALSLRN
jgi:hypothetical protein